MQMIGDLTVNFKIQQRRRLQCITKHINEWSCLFNYNCTTGTGTSSNLPPLPMVVSKESNETIY